MAEGETKNLLFLGLLLAVFMMTGITHGQRIEIALSHVDNVGNAPDPATGRGAVSYEYEIGTYDITLAQYTAFLNAVAGRDKYKLYSPKMAQTGNPDPSDNVDEIDNRWAIGIARNGESGEYTYSVIGTSGSIPAVWITWFDAARFCNWMHNGQPNGLGEVAGSTETGAYTLNGDWAKGGEKRNPDARWWIPNADEWYKAAFYDPRLNGGAGGYWQYPTESNTPPGNIIGSGSNMANAISNTTFSTKGPKNGCFLSPVGAYVNSRSYYGCFDMGGNAAQWTDTYISSRFSYGAGRGMVGGSPNIFTFELKSANDRCNAGGVPEREGSWEGGFRVATAAGARAGQH